MLKKFGTVAVGVTAGLVAMAPLASAGEAPQDSGDGGHSHSHGHGDPHGHKKFNATCDFDAGDASAISDISGESLANAVTQLPVSGNNGLNLLDCSSFLNNNLNGNLSGNNVSLFGDNAVVD